MAHIEGEKSREDDSRAWKGAYTNSGMLEAEGSQEAASGGNVVLLAS